MEAGFGMGNSLNPVNRMTFIGNLILYHFAQAFGIFDQ